MKPVRHLGSQLKALLLWLSNQLPEAVEVESAAAPPPTPPSLPPSPLADVEVRCTKLRRELDRMITDLRGPPQTVANDLAGDSPHLIWHRIEPSELGWITANRLRELDTAFHKKQLIKLDYPGPGDVVWCNRDFDSAEEAAQDLHQQVLPKYPWLRLTFEIFDRAGLGAGLLGEAGKEIYPQEIALKAIFNPADLLQVLTKLQVGSEYGWNQLGLDFEHITVFVVLSGQAPRINTRLFQLCDVEHLTEALSAAASSRPELALARQVDKQRRKEGDLPRVGFLTPLHFDLGERTANPDERHCQRLAAELAMVYLGNRTTLDPTVRVRFRGYQVAEVELPREPTLDPGLATGAAALCQLVCWACDERHAEKLMVVERLIAPHLGTNQQDHYHELLQAAPRILISAQENWEVYLEQATQMYFEQQKELGGYLAAKVAQYGDRLQAVLKGLTGYGITLVGFFLTDYLVKQQDPAVPSSRSHVVATVFFWYSLAILLVTLGHAATEEWLLSGELAGERERLAKLFGEPELKKSVDRTVKRRKWGFRGLLVLLAVVAGAALLLFYQHIRQRYGGLHW